MAVDKETATLLRDLYVITHMQAQLDKEGRTLVVKWAALRLRLEDALIRNGVEIPHRPEIGSVEEEFDAKT